MAFDFYTQPSIPHISASLFGDAAQQGVNIGNAQPLPLTAALQGISEGASKGLQMAGQYQNIQLQKQQQELNQIKLEEAPYALEVAKQKAAAAPDLIEAQRAKANYDTEFYTQAGELQTQLDSFNTNWSAADPLTRKGMIFDPQYTDLFASKPRLYNQAVSSIGQYLTPAELQATQLTGAKLNTNSAYNTRMMLEAQKGHQIETDAINDFYIKEAAKNAGITPLDVSTKVEAVPSGYYDIDPVTRTIKTDSFGKRITRPDAAKGSTTWDYKFGNKIVASGVPKDSYKTLVNHRDNLSWTRGEYLNNALTSIDKTFNEQASRSQNIQALSQPSGGTAYAPEPEPISGQPVVAEQPVSTKIVSPNPAAVVKARAVPVLSQSGKVNISSNPQAFKVVQETLGLPDAKFKSVQPEVKKFLSTAEELPTGWFGRYSTEQVKEQLVIKDNISSYSAGAEFDTDESLQKQYTPERVVQHNKTVREVKAILRDPIAAQSYGRSGYLTKLNIENMEEVNTPKELYILNRRGYFNTSLDNLFKNFQDQLTASKIAALKAGNRGNSVLEVLSR